jgi:hypothetical protein
MILCVHQSALNEMAKTGSNDRVRADYKTLFATLHRAFLGVELAILRSMNHEAGTIAVGVLKDCIRWRLSTLSQVQLKASLPIQGLSLHAQLGGGLTALTWGRQSIVTMDLRTTQMSHRRCLISMSSQIGFSTTKLSAELVLQMYLTPSVSLNGTMEAPSISFTNAN